MTKITFIGLGIMGSRMAKNLLQKASDIELTVFNRTTSAAKPLQEIGAKVADSAFEAVGGTDIVFTMLSTPEVVKTVAMDKTGFLSNMKENALWVDCSTVNPSFTLRANQAAKEQGIRFVDAPVAGTKPHAENAQLAFFVGGEKSDLGEIEPYLKTMGANILHIGAVGKGAAYKTLINSMLAQSMLIFSETVVLGEKMGLSRDFLLQALPKAPVIAPFTQFKAKMIQEGDYEVQFPLEWMHKDLRLAVETAAELNHPLQMTRLAKDIYAQANKAGLGRKDFAAIHAFIEQTSR